MLFTFAVLVYNQEALVLETLESIKYQIVNYGIGLTIDIIIVDDCSKDRSAEYIDKWLSKNHMLFNEMVFYINKENCGTVKNFNRVMSESKSEHIKIIAGDDLITKGNIFSEFKKLNDNTIVACFSILIKNNKLTYDKWEALQFYKNKKHKKTFKYIISQIKQSTYFSAPSTIYKKSLFFNGKCPEFSANFKLIEDYPSYYSMIKNIPNLNIEFHEKFIALYRISETSVSHQMKHGLFKLDEKNLRTIYIKEETNPLKKIYYCILFSPWIHKYLNPILYINQLKKVITTIIIANSKGFIQFEEKLKNEIENNKYYYCEIKEKATDFINEVNNINLK